MTADIEKYVDYLKFPGSSWKRPAGPAKVWRIAEGRRKNSDGEIPKFSIQEAPKELEDEVIEFMTHNFIREEPLCNDQGVADDPLAVREFRTLWREIVRQGMSVVALKVNSDPAAKPVIAGANVLQVITAEDEEADSESVIEYKSRSVNHVMGSFLKLVKEAAVLKKYAVDKYLGALGLSVDSAFRGQGLGEELLRARDDIGIAYQIPVSETVFTATASQILASRVGFEVLLERKYSELLDDEGNVAFPGVTVEFIKRNRLISAIRRRVVDVITYLKSNGTCIWRVVDGRRKAESGEIPRFCIQEVPKELENEVIDFMTKHFIPEAPICADRGVAADPLGVREFQTVWRQLLRQGVSIVALEMNPDPAVKPVIAGVNILSVVTAEDEADAESDTKIRSRSLNQLMMTPVGKLSQQVDVLREYGVDKYLDALGLSVDPSLRGQGMGEELLRVRDDIGLAYQIPVSKTMFTSTVSQILASRVGFEKKYSELLDQEGKVAYPTVTVDSVKIMGKRLG